MSVSPDPGDGSRMSWVGLEDTPDGIKVSVSDTPEVDGKFVDYDVALLRPYGSTYDQVLDQGQPWRWTTIGCKSPLTVIQFRSNGPAGGCFTTWENYYRTAPEQAPPPNVNTPASINRLQFRSGFQGPPELATTGGYLFDDVSSTTANGPGPPADCSGDPPDDIDIDKTTQTRFARPGDLITYKITVRNRGDAPARRLRTCDRAPRALKFVRSSRNLRRAAGGRRLCLTFGLLQPGQSRTFQATFRLRANVTADTVTNGASADTPTGSAPSASPPERPPRAAATPGRRQGRRDDRGAGRPGPELRGGAESPRPRSLLR